MLKIRSLRFGGHSLSVCFSITNLVDLEAAMKEVADRGGKIFELPFLLCQLKWEDVAAAAKRAGIKEISFCHFWPVGKDGKPICGDPLGTYEEVEKALKFFDQIISAAEILRQGGIQVRFVDGPTWGLLGHEYKDDEGKPVAQEVLDAKVVSFLRAAGDKLKKYNLTLAVEFLRPEEDKVIGSTARMIAILQRVNHSNVKMHYDVFHSLRRGENPAEMIRLAKKWIVYLHLHGDYRVAPGSESDQLDWTEIGKAILEIESGVEEIPAISEPFGEATCKEEPALGEGLEAYPMGPLDVYLDTTITTFRRDFGNAGLSIAA